MVRGAVAPRRRLRHHQVAEVQSGVQGTTAPDPHQGPRSHPDQLLHRDGRRGAADPGGGDADRDPVQASRVGGELTVGSHLPGALQARRDRRAPPGIAGEQHVLADLAGLHLEVVLPLSHHRRNVSGLVPEQVTQLHPPILADASVSISAPLLAYLRVRSAAVLDASLA